MEIDTPHISSPPSRHEDGDVRPHGHHRKEVYTGTSLPVPPPSDPPSTSPFYSFASSATLSTGIVSAHHPARAPLVWIINDETKLPYDDERFKDVPGMQNVAAQRRRPRKTPAKRLDKYNKTPGQKAFTFITTD
ncbi:hypothetical protein EW145_g1139 [Phellinidium pouzarii]|uniref:Uncharacterized protein n=1 Tax=Phellinidium pouzarii TaxID=167371 RepID=A0A4S4LL47_9AGAM|nr:hypothetical protein EW145_g1139 [Phellinidium pouzarii]